MIVNVRLEVTDEQRSVLSLRLQPKALKRLATRSEFNEYVTHQIAALTAVQASIVEPAALSEDGPELLSPEKALPVFFATEGPEIEKHGTGIKPALLSINNAMFGLANAARQLNDPNLQDIVDKVESLREELVIAHDKEFGE